MSCQWVLTCSPRQQRADYVQAALMLSYNGRLVG